MSTALDHSRQGQEAGGHRSSHPADPAVDRQEIGGQTEAGAAEDTEAAAAGVEAGPGGLVADSR